jgi:hypothetical protein
MHTEDRVTVGAHAATWSRTIRLFADSEAGSQTMRAAGGLGKGKVTNRR